MLTRPERVAILNVLATSPSSRLGGLQIQLKSRLREERKLREVALLHPGVLEVSARAWRSSAFGVPLGQAIANAMSRTAARAIVLEGTEGVPIDQILRIDDVVVAIHDLSLTHDPSAQEFLRHVRAIIFPSAFLRDHYREQFELSDRVVHIIEPGIEVGAIQHTDRKRNRIAFAGNVRAHKGGLLLAAIIEAVPSAEWHIFGGGDENLLRMLRHMPSTFVHGYYRAGSLPALLARHEIGLALLPSVVPESYSLALSECWQAGVPVVAFDHGAHAERIRRDGGGWLARLDAGAAGIAGIVRRWMSDELTATIPVITRTPRDAAEAHVSLYRSLGLLD
jgi:glycosyltransferase involved in cell wall biosynthesis